MRLRGFPGRLKRSARAMIWFLERVVVRAKAPEIVQVLMYRDQFFGKPYSIWQNSAQRRPLGLVPR